MKARISSLLFEAGAPLGLRLLLASSLIGAPAIAGADAISYFVYDGQNYSSAQLEQAAKSPIPMRSPERLENGSYLVMRSSDGHFYLPGSVNGFPMTWLVDTGATSSVIPMAMARNAGLRAGKLIAVETAGGRVKAGLSENNTLVVGSFLLKAASLGIAEDLRTPLLGADALNRFSVTSEGGAMLISIRR